MKLLKVKNKNEEESKSAAPNVGALNAPLDLYSNKKIESLGINFGWANIASVVSEKYVCELHFCIKREKEKNKYYFES